MNLTLGGENLKCAPIYIYMYIYVCIKVFAMELHFMEKPSWVLIFKFVNGYDLCQNLIVKKIEK